MEEIIMITYETIKCFFAKYGEVEIIEFQTLENIEFSNSSETYSSKKINGVKKMLIPINDNQLLTNFSTHSNLEDAMQIEHQETMNPGTGIFSGNSVIGSISMLGSMSASYTQNIGNLLNGSKMLINDRRHFGQGIYKVFDECEVMDISPISDKNNVVECTAYYKI